MSRKYGDIDPSVIAKHAMRTVSKEDFEKIQATFKRHSTPLPAEGIILAAAFPRVSWYARLWAKICRKPEPTHPVLARFTEDIKNLPPPSGKTIRFRRYDTLPLLVHKEVCERIGLEKYDTVLPVERVFNPDTTHGEP